MTNSTPKRGRTYIGDGAYASYDGMHVIVECDRENGRNWVALDTSDVLPAFLAFVEQTFGVTIEVSKVERKDGQQTVDTLMAAGYYQAARDVTDFMTDMYPRHEFAVMNPPTPEGRWRINICSPADRQEVHRLACDALAFYRGWLKGARKA